MIDIVMLLNLLAAFSCEYTAEYKNMIHGRKYIEKIS